MAIDLSLELILKPDLKSIYINLYILCNKHENTSLDELNQLKQRAYLSL